MIDWSFIGGLEGRRLDGYVPRDESGVPLAHSGVTIATGCDLGWATPRELRQFPDAVQARVRPYLGRFGSDAAAFVAAHPLAVSPPEADAIDRATFADETNLLVSAYARHALRSFVSLPDRAQTVIASVAFQYGVLARKTPHFWAAACARDYESMHAILKDFGDDYPTRRHAEADYLAPLCLGAPALTNKQ